MKTLMLVLVALGLVAGCGSETTTDASDGQGGSETTASQGGGGSGGQGGGGETTVSTTSISTSSTTTTALPECGTPEPVGCTYPEPFLGYWPDAIVEGGFLPAPGRETDGGSASCFEPMVEGESLGRALVGFASDPPETFALDAWTQTGSDPGERVMAPTVISLESTFAGPSGLTMGVYTLTTPLSGAGLTPCVGTKVVDYLPFTLAVSDVCYQPAHSWWYGLPITGNPEKPLTWAMLACPKSDQILSYYREMPYGLLP